MKNYVWTVEFPLKMINELGVDLCWKWIEPFLLLYYVLIEGEWVDTKIIPQSQYNYQFTILFQVNEMNFKGNILCWNNFTLPTQLGQSENTFNQNY